MSYKPEPLPLDIEGMTPALRELWERDAEDLHQAQFHSQDRVLLTKFTAAPARLEDGAAYYANGSTWNPGDGKGWYVYDKDADKFTILNNVPDSPWQGFDSILSAGAGSFDVAFVTTRYKKNGNIVFFNADIRVIDKGTASFAIIFTLPFVANFSASAVGRESSVTGKMVASVIPAGDSIVYMANYDNSDPIANGGVYIVSGSYEVL